MRGTSRGPTSTTCAAYLRPLNGRIEFNIEGDPRPDLLELVHAGEAGPVHARAGSSRRDHEPGRMAGRYASATPWRASYRIFGHAGMRVSLFVDRAGAADPLGGGDGRRSRRALYRAVRAGVRRVASRRRATRSPTYTRAAELAHALGLGVNAGHDLDLDNLVVFRRLPHLDEVSIGHALVSYALFVGLAQSVREYLDVLAL